MVRQCSILFGCLALGELVVFLTGIKLPASIIGMLLLTLFLKLKWIKLSWVKGLCDFLVANLGFFFVPPGVALMLYFDIIKKEFMPILVSVVVSTTLVLVCTGWVHQWILHSKLFRKYMLLERLHNSMHHLPNPVHHLHNPFHFHHFMEHVHYYHNHRKTDENIQSEK